MQRIKLRNGSTITLKGSDDGSLHGIIEERSALPKDMQGALKRIDQLEEEIREYTASDTGRFYAHRAMEWLREEQAEVERLRKAIEAAPCPHGETCRWQPCDCWKREAESDE